MTDQLSGGVVQPTDAQIEAEVTTAVQQGSLSWMGFREDAEGRFTLPVLSRSHYGLVRLGFSLAVPQAPLQAEPVPVVASESMGDCGNETCKWRGRISDCRRIGSIGPCCPLCDEIIEPDATPQAEPAVAEQARTLAHDPQMLPSNQYLLKYMCARAGIELGTDRIDVAIKKAAAALTSQSTPPPESAGQGLKDHEIAKLVSDLRDVAVSFHGHQSLRERIAYLVRPLAANPTAQPDGGSKA